MTDLVKATLYEEGQNPKTGVTFQFNPTAISVSHTAPVKDVGIKTSDTNSAGLKESAVGATNLTNSQVLEKIGRTQLRLGELLFDGMDVPKNCGKLLGWSYSYAGKVGGHRGRVQLPSLVFAWGQFAIGAGAPTALSVLLTRADVVYQRFSPQGRPTRAKVNIELQPLANNPMRQNPTSGGPPDRRGHVVIDGETLPSISVAHYGDASGWRRLAEVNGIDDPLRLRPGATVFIPQHRELDGAT